MRIALLSWCRTGIHYYHALRALGQPPALVVTGEAAPAREAFERAATGAAERVTCAEPDADGLAIVEHFERHEPDLTIVAGWPRRIGPRVRELSRLGIVNCHPSLLPDYRGRDPLFWALLNGEAQVGITIHHLTERIDRGPILFQRPVAVGPRVTTADLAEAVDRAGAELMGDLLQSAESGRLPVGTVPEEAGSYFRPVREGDGELDWTRGAEALDRRVRACEGVIPAYTTHHGMKLVVLRARPVRTGHDRAAGTVLSVAEDAVTVAAAQAAAREPDALAVTRWLFVGRIFEGGSICELLPLATGERLG